MLFETSNNIAALGPRCITFIVVKQESKKIVIYYNWFDKLYDKNMTKKAHSKLECYWHYFFSTSLGAVWGYWWYGHARLCDKWWRCNNWCQHSDKSRSSRLVFLTHSATMETFECDKGCHSETQLATIWMQLTNLYGKSLTTWDLTLLFSNSWTL